MKYSNRIKWFIPLIIQYADSETDKNSKNNQEWQEAKARNWEKEIKKKEGNRVREKEVKEVTTVIP